ncbi:MAG: restriction endonuclease subunit S [Lentisphaerae bacterium]|nr:restriction endonuclease subunit S [Lentisphaerota bacterium]
MKAPPVKTLDELVENGVIQLTRGKIISKKDMTACPGNFPVYSSAKGNDGKFGEYGRFMFDEELITWSVDGGGRLFHRPRHKFSVTNVGGVPRVRDRNVLDYKYLYYVLSLRHSEITFDWVKKAHPSVIRKLYKDIPVPPLPEQQRIVGILDEAFEGIATAKANAEKNLQNARALFESHLQAVFTQRGEGWVEKTLGDVCETTQGVQIPKNLQFKSPGENRRRYLYISDFDHDENLKYVEDIYPNKIVTKNDLIVVNTGATAGKIFRGIDGVLSNNLFKVTLNPDQVNGDFLYYFVTSSLFKDHQKKILKGTANPHMGHENFKSTSISIPSLRVQIDTVEAIDALRAETQRLESLYQQKLAALETLKKSLLHQAFTGKL